MAPTKTINRSDILKVTFVFEGLLLLVATIWSHFLGLRLLPALEFNYKLMLVGVAVGAVMALSGYGFYLLSRAVPFMAQLRQLVDQVVVPLVAELKPIDLLIIAVVSGFCEEVFFRGVAQRQIGLSLTSLAFGLLHDPTLRNVPYCLLTAFYGAVLGLLYIKTGNLWAPIFAHAVHNLILFVLARYLLKPPASSVEQG